MDLPASLNLQRLSLTLLPNHPQPKDPNHWNSIIKHQTKLKNDHAILSTYTHMESLSILPTTSTLPLIFKACSRLNAVERGQQIHFRIRNTNLIQNVRVRTSLVDFYCKCGLFGDAQKVFDEMRERDVVLWNAMISGFFGGGFYEEGVLLFKRMGREGLRPNSGTVVALILACGEAEELRMGKEVHGYCLRSGLFDADPRVGTALIGFYLRYDVGVSRVVFDSIVLRNIVSWNAMIGGYFDVGDDLKGLRLFVRMVLDGVEFDCVTMLVVIQACAEFGYYKLGVLMHQLAVKFGVESDLFIANALLNMYSKNGSLELSCKLFELVTNRDVALWNSMISAYIEFGCHKEAMSLFIRMQTEGIRAYGSTVVIMLSMCAELDDGLRNGKSLHALAVKNGIPLDVSLGNALLSMYAELTCLAAVQKVFDTMMDPDVISWNTLLLALARNNLRARALELFERMRESSIKSNSHTMISILAACEGETCLNVGRSIHGYAIKNSIEMNLSLNTALTDMYVNCGDEATARNLFEGCPNKDVIAWNSLITSYLKNNQAHKALELFNHMISEVEPNPVTITNVLSSCTQVANLPLGQCLHAFVLRRESFWDFDASLANAFITLYAKCGSMQNAENIFKMLLRRDIISWNSLITGYGTHGRGHDAIVAFSQMLEDGFKPNGVTFISLLSACSHSGLIEQGLQLFHSMVQDFNITPELIHYGCVVDLLGRGGCLYEARDFINSMPIEPDASLWRALLSACRDHSDTDLAKIIFEKLIEVEPMNAGNYVLLSNIYAASGLWLEVRQLRTRLNEMGLQKPPGISWIVVRSQVHYFTCGDISHPLSDEIYWQLSFLLSSIKEIGYVPDLRWVLHDE